MSIWDDIVDRAKDVANVAGRKTKEVVGFSKLKLQAMQISSDTEEVFERLGRLVYEEKKSGMNNSDLIGECFAEVERLEAELAQVNAKINETKVSGNCPNCYAANPENAVFCSHCGERLEKSDFEGPAAAGYAAEMNIRPDKEDGEPVPNAEENVMPEQEDK